jgi:hypothetical protein
VADPQKRADRSVANPDSIRRHRTLNQVRQRQDAARRAPVGSRGTSNSSHAPPAINPPPDGVAGFACHICVRTKLQNNAWNVIQHASTQRLEFPSEFTDERMRLAARTLQSRVMHQSTIRARTNLLRRPKQLPLDSEMSATAVQITTAASGVEGQISTRVRAQTRVRARTRARARVRAAFETRAREIEEARAAVEAAVASVSHVARARDAASASGSVAALVPVGASGSTAAIEEPGLHINAP